MQVSGNLYRNGGFVLQNVGLSLLGDPRQHGMAMHQCNQKPRLGLLGGVPNPPDSISSLHQIMLGLFQLTNWIFFWKAWQLDL